MPTETYWCLGGQTVNTRSFEAARRDNNRRLYGSEAGLISHWIGARPLPSRGSLVIHGSPRGDPITNSLRLVYYSIAGTSPL
jgi:hypothetical protein